MKVVKPLLQSLRVLTILGCLIVEVHNHKVATNNSKASESHAISTEKSEPTSIHNTNSYLTPSPWVPYPKDSADPKSSTDKSSDAEKSKPAQDKENMPGPGQRNGPRITTVVLHPTAMSGYIDIAIKATTPANGSNKRQSDGTPFSAIGGRSQTPMLVIPSNPTLGMDPPPAKRQKREKMELDAKNLYPVESQIALATSSKLYLEPTKRFEQTIALLDLLRHPDHSADVPKPKTRKKTVAEMAAEESAAAVEEKYLLTLDDRHSTTAGGAATDVDGQVGGATFEPRFERFKAIENIKMQVEEQKRREKLNAAEAIKKQQMEAEAREKLNKEAEKRQEEQRAQAMRMSQQQMANREAQRRQMAMQQQKANLAAQAAGGHGHPQVNMVNQAMAGMNPQQRMLQQQFSQAQSASPVVRNSTPMNMSSPMVGNMGVPMQTTTSSMGGSPPRPGSVVPTGSQMSPLMAQAMRTQGSQQSHSGTPRMATATPNMSNIIPPVNQTPRMAQPSPRPGQMGQAQQMGMMGTNVPPEIRAQILSQQQQQQQQLRLRQQAQAQALNMSPQQQLTPQQMQQLAMQQNGPMMNQNPVAQQYAAQMRLMQAQQASQAGQPQGMMQNGMNMMGGQRQVMTPQMVQAAQQAALQAQAQQQGQMGQAGMPMAQIDRVRLQQEIQRHGALIYQQQYPMFSAQHGGNPPPEAINAFKLRVQQAAHQKVKQIAQRAAQARLQQQMMGQQGQMGMVNGGGMNPAMQQGMQGQMGMQRPPGM